MSNPSTPTDPETDERTARTDIFDAPQIMIDIETIGLEPGCVIASIGAVRFDGHGLGDTFYKSVDIETCADAGLTVDAETLVWWLDQPDVTREQLRGGLALSNALVAFTHFCEATDAGDQQYWANSPKFDMAILEAAYDAVDGDTAPPWEFYQLRDYRTLTALPDAQVTSNEGVEHHALDDAVHQAATVIKTYREMVGAGPVDLSPWSGES